MTHEPERQAPPATPQRPYVTPILKIFGGASGITGSVDMAGSKDGGANNSKT